MRDAISQAWGKSNCHNQKPILNVATVPDSNQMNIKSIDKRSSGVKKEQSKLM